MRHPAFLPAAFLAMMLGACGAVRDTPVHHAVHKGETAVLSPRQDGPVWIAVSRNVSEDVNRASESGDAGALAALEKTGRAFAVEKGSRVEVIAEGYNDREIRVVSASHAGRTGWVPFEWLQPAPESQR